MSERQLKVPVVTVPPRTLAVFMFKCVEHFELLHSYEVFGAERLEFCELAFVSNDDVELVDTDEGRKKAWRKTE